MRVVGSVSVDISVVEYCVVSCSGLVTAVVKADESVVAFKVVVKAGVVAVVIVVVVKILVEVLLLVEVMIEAVVVAVVKAGGVEVVVDVVVKYWRGLVLLRNNPHSTVISSTSPKENTCHKNET